MKNIEKLLSYNEWLRFLEYKKQGGHLSKAELNELSQFIENREYTAVAEHLNSGGFFGIPEAVSINKAFSDKKRTVFTFSKEENYIQKMLAYQLLEYDCLFSGNLYSFRQNMGVKKAVTRLVFNKNIGNMYSYKLDISDYFNSVNPYKLLPRLERALYDDAVLYGLIRDMLLNPYAKVDGKAEKIKKGILAGSPLSGFLANLYLCELDKHFEEIGVLYARYSDDIILFADNKGKLDECINYVIGYLHSCDLDINEDKVCMTAPGEAWSFLGFRYKDGIIDISDVSIMKLKKKMRRKARALLRWKNKKNAEPERAVRAFIKYFNRKLYDNPVNNEITWCRWYFPIINTSDSLKQLDEYMQQCIRYIATGKQTKSKYNFTYEQIKSLGYVTLVNSYYNHKNK